MTSSVQAEWYAFGRWCNREFPLEPLEEKKRLFFATPQSWKEYKPCLALVVPSNPVFAYKATAMVGVDEVGTERRKLDVFLRVSISDHFVTVIMQFLERDWPWSRERLEIMTDFYPRMTESGCCVFFLLPPGAINKVRCAVSIESLGEHGILRYRSLRRCCVQL